MRMAAPTIVTYLTGPHLMPGLRHIQHQTVLIDRLEGEGHICRNLRQEAGVWITVHVFDSFAGSIELPQGNLPENTESFIGMVEKGRPDMRTVAPMRRRLHRQNTHGIDLFAVIFAGISPLPSPVGQRLIRTGVERLQAIKFCVSHAWCGVAFIKTGRADHAKWRTRRQVRRLTPIVGEPREHSGLIDLIDVLVGHHSTRLHLVVLRIILDEHQFFRAVNRASSSQEIEPAIIKRTVHRTSEIIGRSWRPYE
jgi:hypothetical protein